MFMMPFSFSFRPSIPRPGKVLRQTVSAPNPDHTKKSEPATIEMMATASSRSLSISNAASGHTASAPRPFLDLPKCDRGEVHVRTASLKVKVRPTRTGGPTVDIRAVLPHGTFRGFCLEFNPWPFWHIANLASLLRFSRVDCAPHPCSDVALTVTLTPHQWPIIEAHNITQMTLTPPMRPSSDPDAEWRLTFEGARCDCPSLVAYDAVGGPKAELFLAPQETDTCEIRWSDHEAFSFRRRFDLLYEG